MGGSGILGAFEELVLVAVAAQRGAAYGVSVRRALAEVTGRDVSMGAVHATLDRLEEKGLASSAPERERERPGRPRRCYEATPGGLEALRHTRAVRARAWAGLPDGVLPAGEQGRGA